MKTGVVLPEAFLRCVSEQDREKLKLGLTAEEFMNKGAAANEKSLQRLLVNYLRLKGIEPIVSAMHKRTSNNLGTPDILFAVRGFVWDGGDQRVFETFACAIEAKMPGKKMEQHQEQMAIRMSLAPNGWTHAVIHSLDEMIKFLKQIGIQ